MNTRNFFFNNGLMGFSARSFVLAMSALGLAGALVGCGQGPGAGDLFESEYDSAYEYPSNSSSSNSSSSDCPGGSVLESDGVCRCPSGTYWNGALCADDGGAFDDPNLLGGGWNEDDYLSDGYDDYYGGSYDDYYSGGYDDDYSGGYDDYSGGSDSSGSGYSCSGGSYLAADGYCYCPDGTYWDGWSCVSTGSSGGTNGGSSSCPGGSYMAADGSCYCPDGTYWDGYNCVRTGGGTGGGDGGTGGGDQGSGDGGEECSTVTSYVTVTGRSHDSCPTRESHPFCRALFDVNNQTGERVLVCVKYTSLDGQPASDQFGVDPGFHTIESWEEGIAGQFEYVAFIERCSFCCSCP